MVTHVKPLGRQWGLYKIFNKFLGPFVDQKILERSVILHLHSHVPRSPCISMHI